MKVMYQYYFKSDSLILLIDKKGTMHDKQTPEFRKLEKNIYTDALLYKNYQFK